MEDESRNIEMLKAQVNGLEGANLRLQVRVLEAELDAMRSAMALIHVRGPIAEAQLAMLQKQLKAREPKLAEAPVPGAQL